MATNKKQYALITGASNGIGLELAKLFAQDGYNLILVARTKDKLQDIANELGNKHSVDVIPLSKDLFNREAPQQIYDEAKAKGITVSVLVNDAGQGEWGEFVDIDIEREMDIIQLNIVSLVHLTKLFLRDMLQRNEGKILNIDSVVGKVPSPLMAVYAATKAFVYSFTNSVVNEIKNSDVSMTMLLPGATDTDFFGKAGAEQTKVYQEGKLADPADVAKDGYDALMKGDLKVTSGLKNKMQTGMSNVMPDQALANSMKKQMEPADGEKKK